MSWQQVKPFVQSKGGTTPNMCLANVRSGYQIKNLLPDAWTAWQQTEQHKGNPPAGVDVPVFFSYTATIDGVRKNYGHIGVRLKNGKFWSDGKTYPTIAAYTANHSPVYVGWGESVNNERVIKEQKVIDRGRAIRLLRLTRRGTSERQIKALIGRNEDEWLDEVYKASWFKEQTAKLSNSAQALKDKIISFVKGA